jgi:hypothetical protein
MDINFFSNSSAAYLEDLSHWDHLPTFSRATSAKQRVVMFVVISKYYWSAQFLIATQLYFIYFTINSICYLVWLRRMIINHSLIIERGS